MIPDYFYQLDYSPNISNWWKRLSKLSLLSWYPDAQLHRVTYE